MTKGKRKKRNWIILGLFSIIVIALAVGAMFLVFSNTIVETKMTPTVEAEALSLEDVLYGRVNPAQFNATWVSGRQFNAYSDFSL